MKPKTSNWPTNRRSIWKRRSWRSWKEIAEEKATYSEHRCASSSNPRIEKIHLNGQERKTCFHKSILITHSKWTQTSKNRLYHKYKQQAKSKDHEWRTSYSLVKSNSWIAFKLIILNQANRTPFRRRYTSIAAQPSHLFIIQWHILSPPRIWASCRLQQMQTMIKVAALGWKLSIIRQRNRWSMSWITMRGFRKWTGRKWRVRSPPSVTHQIRRSRKIEKCTRQLPPRHWWWFQPLANKTHQEN